MHTIGFAGTAKNTGKTTAALQVLDRAAEAGLCLAVTSIGYDGEQRDHVTGLPKPRYALPAGTLLATAEQTLPVCGRLEILETSPIRTILGQVVIARMTEPGPAALAGPNTRADIETILARLQALGAELCLLDGALNRMAPMMAADGLVLSTGAAFDEDIAVLAAHVGALAELFALPRQSPPSGALVTQSLLTPGSVETALNGLLSGVSGWVLRGAVSPRLVAAVLEKAAPALQDRELLFEDPVKLAVSGDPRAWARLLQQAHAMAIRPGLLATLPLRLVTVNPFYPRYWQRDYRYEAAYVDAGRLLISVQAAITSAPVADLIASPPPDLLKIVLGEYNCSD